jgi:hypothetical protein
LGPTYSGNVVKVISLRNREKQDRGRQGEEERIKKMAKGEATR